jgi:hypothetical protein
MGVCRSMWVYMSVSRGICVCLDAYGVILVHMDEFRCLGVCTGAYGCV